MSAHVKRGAWVLYSKSLGSAAGSAGKLLEFTSAEAAVSRCIARNAHGPEGDWTVQKVYGRELDRLRTIAQRRQR